MAFRLWCHPFTLNSSTSSNYSWTKPFICTPQGLAELKTWRKNDLTQDQNTPASRRLHFTFLAKRQKNVTLLAWGTFSSLASWPDTALCRAAGAVCWLRMKARLSFFQRWAPASGTQGHSPSGAKGQGPACTLCSEPCRLQPAGGQDRMEGPSPKTPSLGRSVGLSHTLLGGAATCSQGIHQPILHIHIRCACGDLTRTTHERVFKCLYELNQLTSNINKM